MENDRIRDMFLIANEKGEWRPPGDVPEPGAPQEVPPAEPETAPPTPTEEPPSPGEVPRPPPESRAA